MMLHNLKAVPLYALLAAILMLAGCASKAPAPAATDTLTDAAEPSRTSRSLPSEASGLEPALPQTATYWINRSIDAMLLHTVGTVNDHGMIPQPYRMLSLSANLTWTSPGNVQDLDLAIAAPGKEGGWMSAQAQPTDGWFVDRDGIHGLPDSPSHVALDAASLDKFNDCDPISACQWSAWAMVKGGSARVDFSIRVDVTFLAETPGEERSAKNLA